MTDVTTGVYTEETLKSLTKPHIIDLFFKMQKHTNSTIPKLTDEIGNLMKCYFKRPESDVQVFKRRNDILVKQVSPLKCQCWRKAVYSQRKGQEIIKMSNWIVHSALEKNVNVLQHMETNICEEKLESYHRLKKKQPDHSEILGGKGHGYS